MKAAGDGPDDGAGDASERASLRATLAAFDERQKKIVGGLIAIMIHHPARVSEREWIAEQFTQLTLLSGDFDDVGSVQEGVAAVQRYVRANIGPILEAAFTLFRCVGADMAARMDESPTRADAVARALEYLCEP